MKIIKLWIARDKDGCLCFFDKKPYKVEDHYENDGDWLTIIQGDLLYNDFSSVTFENSPQQVELKLIEENDK